MPQRVHWSIYILTLAALLLVAAALFLLPSGWFGRTEASPAVDVRITVDASEEFVGAKAPLVGFVHGITYDETKDHAKTVELISALKPRFWRLAGYNHVYEFVVNAGKFPDVFGTLITVNFQSLFNQKHGFPVGVSPCPADVFGCFETYEELKNAWAVLADEFMKKAVSENLRMDYFDVFAEPNWGWEGVSDQQKLELFKIAHDTARSYVPDIKIIGVDLAGLESNPDSFLKVYVPFFDYVAKNNLRVDVVSWHEFRYPEEVIPRADEMRRLIAERPKLCDPTCPEIHVNEYAGPEYHLIPGFNVGWLYYLEQAGVDQADRACWDDLGGPWKKWSSCWAGVNDMLLDDNATPQPTYWVYKAYADLPAPRLRSESSHPRAVALVGKDDTRREIRMLVGTYAARASDVTITVDHYPYGGSSANVEISKIPNFGNVTRALPFLDAPKVASVPVKDGSITIVLDGFEEGEAYSIVVRAMPSAVK